MAPWGNASGRNGLPGPAGQAAGFALTSVYRRNRTGSGPWPIIFPTRSPGDTVVQRFGPSLREGSAFKKTLRPFLHHANGAGFFAPPVRHFSHC